MLLLLALLILLLALGGGIFISKFLFILLLVALIVAVFSRRPSERPRFRARGNAVHLEPLSLSCTEGEGQTKGEVCAFNVCTKEVSRPVARRASVLPRLQAPANFWTPLTRLRSRTITHT